MSKKDFVAMMVFAIDRDMMVGYTVMQVYDSMCDYISEFCNYYNTTAAETAIDDIIAGAQQSVQNGYSYGKYDKVIMSL